MARDLLFISRRRKRRWALFKFSARVLALGIIFALAVGFFYLPFLRIKSIEISGIESLNRDLLMAKVSNLIQGKYYYLFPKNNILIFPRQEIDNLFANNPRLEWFKISRNVFNAGLVIGVAERKTWAIWCPASASESSCFLMDKTGFLFAPAPVTTGSAILKIKDERKITAPELAQKVLTDEDVSRLKYFTECLPARLSDDVNEVLVQDGGIFNLYLKSGWYLILDSEIKDSQKAFENLVLTLSTLGDKASALEYVDLRFQDKVFYKLK